MNIDLSISVANPALLSGQRNRGNFHKKAVWGLQAEKGEFRLGGFVGQEGNILSVTRSSGIILPNKAGVMQSLDNNTLPRTDRGLYANEQRTNKCRNFNANPTDLTGMAKAGNAAATLTLVDDTAELAAAGLDDICTSGMVFKLDNSFGGATTSYVYLPGYCGNTNPHTMSVYMRATSSARIVLSTSGGTRWSVPAIYTRRSATVTPANATQQLVIEVAAGGIVWFILNQLEEGSFASPPIVTAGAPATRLASDIRAVQGTRPSNGQPEPFPGWEAAGLDGGFTVLFDIEARPRQASARRPIIFSGGTGAFRVETDNSGAGFRVYSSDGSLDGTNNFPGGLGETRRRFAVRAQGTTITTAGSGVGSANNETRGFIQQPTQLNIGNQPELVAPWNDWIYGVQICPPLSDAELLAWVNA